MPDGLHQVLDPRRHEEPGAHVARLLLAPDVARLSASSGAARPASTSSGNGASCSSRISATLPSSPRSSRRLQQVVDRPCRCTARPARSPGRPRWAASPTSRGGSCCPAPISSSVLTQRLWRSSDFGRHHDQRLAELAMQLAAQGVEVARRRARVDDLDVVLGVELQEALEPGRAVLRALALVAVRQQADQAATCAATCSRPS